MQHRGPRSSSLNNYVAEQQTQYSRCWVGVENVFRPKLQHPTVRYIETRQSGMQSRRCEVTALFLTGSCKWARPLKNSCVFSALLRARNAACKLEEKYGNDGEDLGLDTPAEASAMSKRRRVSKAQPLDTKALWVCISVPLAKKAWKLRVLHGEGKDCLYIEFVDANFKALFAAVAASFADEAEFGIQLRGYGFLVGAACRRRVRCEGVAVVANSPCLGSAVFRRKQETVSMQDLRCGQRLEPR